MVVLGARREGRSECCFSEVILEKGREDCNTGLLASLRLDGFWFCVSTGYDLRSFVLMNIWLSFNLHCSGCGGNLLKLRLKVAYKWTP